MRYHYEMNIKKITMKTLLSKHSTNQIPLKHTSFRTDIKWSKRKKSYTVLLAGCLAPISAQ